MNSETEMEEIIRECTLNICRLQRHCQLEDNHARALMHCLIREDGPDEIRIRRWDAVRILRGALCLAHDLDPLAASETADAVEAAMERE